MARYHHGDLRSALIDASLSIARERGIAALGLREVTRAVGVSPNAAYRHFPDHRALVLTAALEAQHRLARVILAQVEDVPLTEQLPAFARAYVGFAVTTAGWFELTCAAQEAPPDHVPTDDDPPPPHLILLRILDDLTAAGAIAHERRPNAEWSAWSAIHGLAELSVRGPLQGLDPAEIDQLAEHVMDTLSRGLADDTTDTTRDHPRAHTWPG